MPSSPAPTTPGAAPQPPLVSNRADARYSCRQIAMATLFGTPIAGALLVATNVARGGASTARSAAVVVVSALVTAIMLGLDAYGFGPLTVVTMPLLAGAALLASARLGLAGSGAGSVGALASVVATWVALGAVAALAIAVVGASPPSLLEMSADVVAYSANERVGYGSGAHRDDAERIVRSMVDRGYLSGHGRVVVDVDRPDAKLRLNVLVMERADELDVEQARFMISDIAKGLDECIVGRLVSPSGAVVASAEACPGRT